MWFSYPHIGTIHDIKIFERVTPPLRRDESLLADKAYVAEKWLGKLIGPIKRERGRQLDDRQAAYNIIHRWYRSSIEHAIGYLKRYEILAGTYR
jgi:hypothetical protein